jgi:membrane-associated phospholipid phosphatase
MNPVLDAGIDLILALQNLGDWLITPMRFFTFLGDELFFLLVLPVLYWSFSAGWGLRVGLMLMLSASVNGMLKMLLTGPRPYFYDVRVRALTAETSFGIPSGHAQNSAAVWGMLAALAARPWAWTAALALIFMIGLSRMFLGVHFPTDVALGWVVGLLLVWGFVRLEPVVVRRLSQQRLPEQLLTVLSISLLLLVIPALIKLSLSAWTIPTTWLDNVRLALPDGELPDPLALSGQFTSAGAFFGLAAGALLLRRMGGFDAGGSWWKRLVRFPLGLVGVIVLYFGLGAVFPRGEELLPYILRFIRYTLVGLWVAWAAPLIFIRLGLAQGSAPTIDQPAGAP